MQIEPLRRDIEDTIELLEELVTVCSAGERGYRRAAEEIHETVFRSLFRCYADQRGQFVSVLETLIERLGGARARPSSSMFGALQRSWSGLVQALAFRGDHGVIDACAQGEEAARRAYEQVLSRRLPIDIRGILEQQLTNVREAQERLSSLRRVL
jgi:uncharacterized protein (TIGR02284 family)